ncbi:unnamed protein product [Amoebophrya sp. A120]|nr:unnamed protein product [Amoebophrya sp. A120]|eukprot:GSA120T00016564001.1
MPGRSGGAVSSPEDHDNEESLYRHLEALRVAEEEKTRPRALAAVFDPSGNQHSTSDKLQRPSSSSAAGVVVQLGSTSLSPNTRSKQEMRASVQHLLFARQKAEVRVNVYHLGQSKIIQGFNNFSGFGFSNATDTSTASTATTKKSGQQTNSVAGGVYHSGVEIFGKEYSYGMTFCKVSTGVMSDNTPRVHEDHTFLESIVIGDCFLSEYELHKIMQEEFFGNAKWLGKNYNILRQNCHHFSDALLQRLDPTFRLPAHLNALAGTLLDATTSIAGNSARGDESDGDASENAGGNDRIRAIQQASRQESHSGWFSAILGSPPASDEERSPYTRGRAAAETAATHAYGTNAFIGREQHGKTNLEQTLFFHTPVGSANSMSGTTDSAVKSHVRMPFPTSSSASTTGTSTSSYHAPNSTFGTTSAPLHPSVTSAYSHPDTAVVSGQSSVFGWDQPAGPAGSNEPYNDYFPQQLRPHMDQTRNRHPVFDEAYYNANNYLRGEDDDPRNGRGAPPGKIPVAATAGTAQYFAQGAEDFTPVSYATSARGPPQNLDLFPKPKRRP